MPMRRWPEYFLQDLHYALRTLCRTPGFTAVAVGCLALGIGANTAIFTLINAVMLRELPVHQPSSLVIMGNPARVSSTSTGSERTDIYSYPMFREIRERNQVFSGIFGSGRCTQLTEGVGDSNEHPRGRLVTGEYFDVLGVKPMLGRLFTAADDRTPGGSPVAVISYDYWERKYARDPGIVGRNIVLNKSRFNIVGVTPKGFQGEAVGSAFDIWLPVTMQAQANPGRNFLDRRDICWLVLMGRRKPGVSFEQAKASLVVLVPQILREHPGLAFSQTPEKIAQQEIPVSPGATGISGVRQQASGALLTLMALVGVVLLIACANLANLLLARATARRKEIAVRLAIGSGRGRLIAQLVTESLLLSFVGGGLGVLFAIWASQGLLMLVSNGPRLLPLDINPDARVLGFTIALSVVTGVVFGLVPALRATRVELASTLKENAKSLAGAASGFSAGRWLVVAQVALSMVLLFGAGLFLRTLNNLETVDLGYARNSILMAQVDPIASGYKEKQFPALCRELLDRIGKLPGVKSATVSENGLFSGTESSDTIKLPGFTPRSDGDLQVNYDRVGAGYFSTVGIPILLGRGIEERDTEGAPLVVVVNETMAKFYFPGQNPIGRQFTAGNPERSYQIVGVARDVHDHDVRGKAGRRYYQSAPQADEAMSAFNFEVRAAGAPASLAKSVREAIRGVDSKLRVLTIDTLNNEIGQTLESDRLVARLSAIFGAVALLLASLGLYGVQSYAVVRRTAEIGVRVALGARSGDVVRMVLREALLMTAIGIAIGIPLAAAAARLISTRLFGLSITDPLTMITAALVMSLIAALAGYIPAHRASRIDPMIALRYE
jgi:predicted permease